MSKKEKEFQKFEAQLQELLGSTDKDFISFFEEHDEAELYGTFFYRYFGNQENANPSFIERLINLCPAIFVKAVRVQKVAFVYPHHWQTILAFRNTQNQYVANWIQTLDLLRSEEAALWKNVTEATDGCLSMPVHSVLIDVSWWYESQRLKEYDENRSTILDMKVDDRENLGTRENARFVVEQFLSYFFFKLQTPKLASNVDADFLVMNYLEKLENLNEKKYNSLVFKALDAVQNWHRMKTSLVSTISFDFNFDLRHSKLGVSLAPKSIRAFTDWELNEVKYTDMYKSYQDKGRIIVHELIRLDRIKIPGLGTDREYYNITLQAEKFAIELLAQDLCIEGFDFEQDGHVDCSIQEHIELVAGFSTNARLRFTDPTDDLLKLKIWDWKKRLIEQAKYAVQNVTLNLSLRWDTSNNWRGIITSDRKLNEVQVSALETLLILNLNKESSIPSKYYNRFAPFIDLSITPFFRIGNFVFSFSNIMGEVGNWGFGLIQNALDKNAKFRSKISKAETDKLEKKFAEAFQEHFSHVAYSKEYEFQDGEKLLKSEIDFMLYEDGYLILAELKRTKLRLNLETAWMEHIQTHSKAISQLEKHKAFLDLKPEFFCEALGLPKDFDFSKVKVIPLAISSSFEDDGCFFGKKCDIQKLSYYEVLGILEKMPIKEIRKAGGSPLKDLVECFSNRGFWQGLGEGKPKTWNDIERPVHLSTKVDLDDVRRHDELTKLAGEAYENKQYTVALSHYLELLSFAPQCPFINESIGNCYSGLQQFQEAQKYYNQALEIVPDYYQLMLNSVYNLKDMQRYEESAEQTLRILSKYGDFPSIRSNAYNYLAYLKAGGFLSEQYGILLNEKMKALSIYNFN